MWLTSYFESLKRKKFYKPGHLTVVQDVAQSFFFEAESQMRVAYRRIFLNPNQLFCHKLACYM